ncbi:OLC1v1038998C1 [Oldenlandia corymbosa var. corymbosa]|uniref:OLC1v1038998C1 n=1 Tax=Oldenlandia corymbosa var. corymbosa TaxID=529605 RepID=A0AAV1D1P9_OLDCO|nr:OLC1v1038998C1 [Oldenlandia corymbosa var. corymbosa]
MDALVEPYLATFNYYSVPQHLNHIQNDEVVQAYNYVPGSFEDYSDLSNGYLGFEIDIVFMNSMRLCLIPKENKFLKVKLRKTEKDECLTARDDIDKSEKMLPTSRADSANASLNADSQGKSSKSFSNSLVEETLNTASSDQNEIDISNSA